MKRFFPILILCLCLTFNMQAQIQVLSRAELEKVENPSLSEDSSNLKFKAESIFADQMTEDSGIKTFTYTFKNVGTDTLRFDRLVTSCSCAVATYTKKSVAPGEDGEIIVKYNPKGHPGRFERKVFVYTDDMQSPSAILRLSVEVERGKGYEGLYPISMGAIRVRRNEILVERGVQAVEKCVFVNVSDGPLRLLCEKAMLPSCLTFKVEPEVVNAGKEGEIIITYDPAKGGVRDRMPVILMGLGLPPSQSTINVIIKEK